MFFTFPPSWKGKLADCGQWFTPEGVAVQVLDKKQLWDIMGLRYEKPLGQTRNQSEV